MHASLSRGIELIKCLSDIFCRVCKIRHILSVIHYPIRGAVCFQFTNFPCDDWENIYTLSYHRHQIGSMNYYPLFRVRSWNNGVRCMSFCILMMIFNCQRLCKGFTRKDPSEGYWNECHMFPYKAWKGTWTVIFQTSNSCIDKTYISICCAWDVRICAYHKNLVPCMGPLISHIHMLEKNFRDFERASQCTVIQETG